MTSESATATYYIPESVDEAVRSLRRVLAQAGLKVTGELDMAGRLLRRLQMDTPACKVLFVIPESMRGAAPSPFHVVVSQRGDRSEIHIMRVPALAGEVDEARTTLTECHRRVAQAIERIAMRAMLGV